MMAHDQLAFNTFISNAENDLEVLALKSYIPFVKILLLWIEWNFLYRFSDPGVCHTAKDR